MTHPRIRLRLLNEAIYFTFLLICSWSVLASRTIYIDAADVETLHMVMNDMKANNKSNYFLFIESGKESIEFLFTRQGLMGEVTEKQKIYQPGSRCGML
ncbi:TPA: hypothetical protein RY405_003985 [Escherichia albertii]|uniref:Uncharacterized protein n=2 Tax=Escherichia albertii TaxID=208962 RepID=A0ABD7E6L0_ESCAL|nr:hypothetical protein [Escherichia albertii]EFZ6210968.1 hypothetical protein [Shigella boydii]CTW31226.1 Uncharacterised protein [Escherichia coli]EEW3330442.1 hypothetical protein [Escherichia albertii]EFE6908910.1 hypothetical protein [Escherichia albertii]EFF0774658.1 hypothetical protein [Escherichia albertii]